MTKRVLISAVAVAAIVALTACSDASKPQATEKTPAVETKKEPPKPPEPVAAQTAFYEMYKPARTWATDLLPLSLASGEVPSLKNDGGKAAMWTAVFVSPSKHEARTFFYSAVDDGPNIHKGVSVGGAQSWSGPTPKSRPFSNSEFVINSDVAYQTAYAKAEEWVKKNPDKTAALLLGSSARYPAPVWFIIWGNTKSGFAAYVNATTGLLEK